MGDDPVETKRLKDRVTYLESAVKALAKGLHVVDKEFEDQEGFNVMEKTEIFGVSFPGE